MLESVEVRPLPLSLTRSLMRIPGLLGAWEVFGGGVLPSLRAAGGCKGALLYEAGGAPGVVGACEWGDDEARLGSYR